MQVRAFASATSITCLRTSAFIDTSAPAAVAMTSHERANSTHGCGCASFSGYSFRPRRRRSLPIAGSGDRENLARQAIIAMSRRRTVFACGLVVARRIGMTPGILVQLRATSVGIRVKAADVRCRITRENHAGECDDLRPSVADFVGLLSFCIGIHKKEIHVQHDLHVGRPVPRVVVERVEYTRSALRAPSACSARPVFASWFA